MDFSFIVPPGVGIASGSVQVFINEVPAVVAPEWTVGTVFVSGRALYAQLTGGTEGKDYQIRWLAIDTAGNQWPRTALCLCAQTS